MRRVDGKWFVRVIGSVAVTALAAATANAQAAGNGMVHQDAMAMQRMSHEAARILDDAGMATAALNNGNKSGALTDIDMALNTRDHLAMTARSHNLAKVVPIYTELDQNTTLGTVMAMKNNGQPVPSAKDPVTVDAVNNQLTFVGVDLDKTKARLTAAKQAIQANNLQAAKDTLNAIGEDLVVAKVSAQTPLLAIRENLGIAQRASAAGHQHEATAALQQASTELTAYAQSNSGQQAQQAQMVQQHIDHMLKSNGQDNMASASTIGMWWNTVNGWMQMPPAA